MLVEAEYRKNSKAKKDMQDKLYKALNWFEEEYLGTDR